MTTTLTPNLPRIFAETPARAIAKIPAAEAPTIDLLASLQSAKGAAEPSRAVTMALEVDAYGPRTSPEKVLQTATERVFGKAIGLDAFERIVDAPDHSKVVVSASEGRVSAKVLGADEQLLEEVRFEPQEDGKLLVTHDVTREGSHAELAPIFGADTAHAAMIGGKKVVEQWRALPNVMDRWQEKYAETLPNGTVIQTTDRDSVNDFVKSTFKDPATRGRLAKPLNAEQLNELFFLPDGAVADLNPSINFNDDSPALGVEVSHPLFARDSRDYSKDGNKVIFHQGLARVDSEHGQATGLGAETFVKAMVASHKYGVDAIHATAAGSGNGTEHVRDGAFVGYYVWPRFGFNGEIAPYKRQMMPSELSGARDMLDLFSRPGGPDWWKRNGSSLEVEFLLDPAGPNVAAFQRYAMERQARAAAAAQVSA